MLLYVSFLSIKYYYYYFIMSKNYEDKVETIIRLAEELFKCRKRAGMTVVIGEGHSTIAKTYLRDLNKHLFIKKTRSG